MKKNRSSLFRSIFIPIREYLLIMKLTIILISFGLFTFASKTNSQATRPSFEVNSATTDAPADKRITGKVTDSSGATLPGVSVVVKGTTNGVITDNNGTFSLVNISENAILQISFVGMKMQEIAVAGKTTINVTLTEETIGIEEVVAIGYGTQKKSTLTGSLSSLNVEKLNAKHSQNLTNLLKGEAAGVVVEQANVPGETAKIRIHGLGTINNNDPLWIVDGVPSGALNQINPNDIESLTVLKDAASTAIYGARGANGVILVTTKKGKKGEAVQFQLSSKIGTLRMVNRLDFLNTQEYADLLWLQFKNSGVAPNSLLFGTGATPVIPKYVWPIGQTADLSKYDIVNNPIMEATPEGTDWPGIAMPQRGSQEFNLSAAGSSGNTNYAFSLGYMNEEGSMRYTGFKRYSLSSNISTKINKWLDVGETVRLAYTDNYGDGSLQSGLYSFFVILPIAPEYDVMGNFAATSKKTSLGADAPTAFLYRQKDFHTKALGANGSAYANFTLMKELKFKSLLGFGVNQSFTNQPLDANIESYLNRTQNQLSMAAGKSLFVSWTNTLNYNKTLSGGHSFDVLLGSESVSSVSEDISAVRQNYFLTTPEFYTLNAGTGAQTNGGTRSEGASFSLFGRLMYDYKLKYLLNATVRRDGSSRFGANNRYGTFPAVGLGWNVIKEDFMAGTKSWLTGLKFRTSWGQSGNDQVGNYNGFTTYGSGLVTNTLSYYPITGSNTLPTAGFQSTTFGNPDAKWETTTSYTTGIDVSLLNHFDMVLDVWRKNTSDMLYRLPIPSVVGQATVPSVNIGSMKNSGIDLQLNYHGSALHNELVYSVNLTLSHYKNELVKLSDQGTAYITGATYTGSTIFTRAQPGQSFPEYYGMTVDGIFQNQAEVDAWPKYGTYNKPGRFKYRDVNGDGIIDLNDRSFIGNPHPDFTSGLTANIKYKNFDVSASLFSSVGNKIANVMKIYWDFNGFVSNRGRSSLYESWGSPYLKDNKDATHPMVEVSDVGNQQVSTWYLEDGSYLRLEDVQIGYTLPGKIANYVGLKNLRISMQASNIFTLTKYSGLDPVIKTSDAEYGVDAMSNQIPSPRRFLVGVNIDF